MVKAEGNSRVNVSKSQIAKYNQGGQLVSGKFTSTGQRIATVSDSSRRKVIDVQGSGKITYETEQQKDARLNAVASLQRGEQPKQYVSVSGSGYTRVDEEAPAARTNQDLVNEERQRLIAKYGKDAEPYIRTGQLGTTDERSGILGQMQTRGEAVEKKSLTYPSYSGFRPSRGDPLGLAAAMSEPGYVERNRAGNVKYPAAFGGGQFGVKQQEAINKGYTGYMSTPFGGGMGGENVAEWGSVVESTPGGKIFTRQVNPSVDVGLNNLFEKRANRLETQRLGIAYIPPKISVKGEFPKDAVQSESISKEIMQSPKGSDLEITKTVQSPPPSEVVNTGGKMYVSSNPFVPSLLGSMLSDEGVRSTVVDSGGNIESDSEYTSQTISKKPSFLDRTKNVLNMKKTAVNTETYTEPIDISKPLFYGSSTVYGILEEGGKYTSKISPKVGKVSVGGSKGLTSIGVGGAKGLGSAVIAEVLMDTSVKDILKVWIKRETVEKSEYLNNDLTNLTLKKGIEKNVDVYYNTQVDVEKGISTVSNVVKESKVYQSMPPVVKTNAVLLKDTVANTAKFSLYGPLGPASGTLLPIYYAAPIVRGGIMAAQGESPQTIVDVNKYFGDFKYNPNSGNRRFGKELAVNVPLIVLQQYTYASMNLAQSQLGKMGSSVVKANPIEYQKVTITSRPSGQSISDIRLGDKPNSLSTSASVKNSGINYPRTIINQYERVGLNRGKMDRLMGTRREFAEGQQIASDNYISRGVNYVKNNKLPKLGNRGTAYPDPYLVKEKFGNLGGELGSVYTSVKENIPVNKFNVGFGSASVNMPNTFRLPAKTTFSSKYNVQYASSLGNTQEIVEKYKTKNKLVNENKFAYKSNIVNVNQNVLKDKYRLKVVDELKNEYKNEYRNENKYENKYEYKNEYKYELKNNYNYGFGGGFPVPFLPGSGDQSSSGRSRSRRKQFNPAFVPDLEDLFGVYGRKKRKSKKRR